MRDLLGWNISLGRWAGVQIRVHAFFLILALMAWQAVLVGAIPGWYCLLTLGVLLAAVVVHEAAHVALSARLGFVPDQVVLWPLGGLAHVSLPHQPLAELITALAGPLANLAMASVCCLALLFTEPGLLSFDPLRPPNAEHGLDGPMVVAIGFWVNWLLLLFNLLPASPLDGGRALRAFLWMRVGYRSAASHAASISRLAGVAIAVLGCLLYARYPFAPLPLGILGCVLIFAPRTEVERTAEGDADDTALGYDFSQGYTSLERHFEPSTTARRREGVVRRWLERRKQARLRRQRHQEEEEDRRVDDILARLHNYGSQGISPEDQALLKRVAARYRNRERR